MAPKKICFGFDGICADMSFFITDLPKYQSELFIKYPWLRPIFNLLIKGEDCELQFESTNFGFETFFDCIFTLNQLSYMKTTHVGANSAIETVTAFNLLRDLAYPIDNTKIYFLGNYSNDVFQKLPKEQRIPSVFLEYANAVKTTHIPISIILPYNEKRGIISFGGLPGIRRVETLTAYLRNIAITIKKLNPDFLAILGATNVFATTTNYENEFKLLDPFLNLRCVGIDLGGTVSWDHDRLERFYQIISNTKIIMGNAEEFKSWYQFKFGESINSSDPLTIYKLVNKLRNDTQIAVCHTKNYQFVLGLESANKDVIKDCMKFANKATVVKTTLGAFPSAKQIAETELKENTFQLPEILEKDAIITRSIDYKIKNPVGLGDIWSCTFILGLISQNIL